MHYSRRIVLLVPVALCTACAIGSARTSTPGPSHDAPPVVPPRVSPPPPSAARELIHGSGPVNVMYAATLVGTFENHLGPAFERAAGFRFLGEGKGSLALANEIKGKIRTPDVFISADVSVNKVLQGAANGDYVTWWVPFATTEMVIGWSPKSRFAADFEAAKAGRRTWESVLEEPGLRFGRTDPEIDPKGYRTMFLFQFDEQRIGDATLARRILGPPSNPSQVFLEEQLVARLQSGELDAGVFFKVEAIEAKFPYLTLPREINQGDLALAHHYATVSYTTRHGTVYRGSPIIYTVTIPRTVRNRPGALAFTQFLLDEPGQAVLAEQGLAAAPPTVEGDPSRVPPELVPWVKVAR
jgi:molybdate/tungstate transport system substrate-binding protein